MPKVSRWLFLVAGVSLMLAAMLSAYGFHGLPGKVPAPKLQSWEWANAFQFYHSMALVLIGVLLRHDPRSIALRAAAGLMMAGLLLFCGSIYVEVLGAPSAIGEIAPIGGWAFMLGWLLTGIGGYRLPG